MIKGNKKYIIYLILSVALSLALLGCIYNIMTGKAVEDQFMSRMMLNLPLCLLIGFMDVWIITATDRYSGISNDIIRILLDLGITTLMCMAIVGSLNYMLVDKAISLGAIVKNSLPVVPWNWIVVLQIELFVSQSRRDKIEKEKAQYQLMTLKNQVNPHFLFNSLNTLASLAYTDANKTNFFAKKLSSVYRYFLTTSEKPSVTLAEEMTFVETYFQLEKIRFGESLQLRIRIPAEAQGKSVIPTSIQMLVENAIKHNINTEQSPLVIEITSSGNTITVSNNYQPRQNVKGNRMGLRNLRQQYFLKGKAIHIEQSESTFAVTLQFIN
ncbi:MAG: histidine kinase [Duncaniella sp.]|uniref:sensor histidine kinase n=1 Tax=Duncaniella sp. TaxID=2518496 RepID=UPI0023CDCC1A|nr:histidine kinase [Duncaniella sp.]MDE6089767.1 histidine kinase [Duncaniella sp.]